jgi:hypothetical protein
LSSEISVGVKVSAGALPSRSLITNGGKKGRFTVFEGLNTPLAELRRRSRSRSRSTHFWSHGGPSFQRTGDAPDFPLLRTPKRPSPIRGKNL